MATTTASDYGRSVEPTLSDADYVLLEQARAKWPRYAQFVLVRSPELPGRTFAYGCGFRGSMNRCVLLEWHNASWRLYSGGLVHWLKTTGREALTQQLAATWRELTRHP